VTYQSNGTARSDTARRLAAAGMWDVEGGSFTRGLRFIALAIRMSVADSAFYQDTHELLEQLGCQTERVVFAREALRRWPDAQWAKRNLERALQRPTDAGAAHRSRRCPLTVSPP